MNKVQSLIWEDSGVSNREYNEKTPLLLLGVVCFCGKHNLRKSASGS